MIPQIFPDEEEEEEGESHEEIASEEEDEAEVPSSIQTPVTGNKLRCFARHFFSLLFH